MDEPPSGYHYAAARVTFENTSENAIIANSSAVYLSDEFDSLYWPTYFRWDSLLGDSSTYNQTLDPAVSATVTNFYLVPDDIAVASVHCACFADAGYVGVPIKRLNARAGDVAPHSLYKQSSVMFDPRGTERGLITFGGPVGSRTTTEDPYDLLITFENTGRQTLLVDPRSVIAFARDGNTNDFSTIFPESFVWEWGPGDLNKLVQELTPGDRAIVYVRMQRLPEQYAIGYLANDQQLIPIAVGCTQCAGGLGRPTISRRG
jgi:hypothetical protein